MATRPAKTRKALTDAAVVERVQSIFINAAEGRRSIADDREYATLRKEFKRRGIPMPSLVKTHPSVDSLMGFMGGIKNRLVREQQIRDEFGPLIASIHNADVQPQDASAWTGQTDRVARLKVVRELLPFAQSAVQTMIDTLAEPGPNGGPLLDEKEDALRHLRELHQTLGKLLKAIDGGRFDDELGQGLAADTVRLTRNIRDNLADEPLPCALAALLLGIFTCTGMPTVGGFLSDATFNLTRKRKAR